MSPFLGAAFRLDCFARARHLGDTWKVVQTYHLAMEIALEPFRETWRIPIRALLWCTFGGPVHAARSRRGIDEAPTLFPACLVWSEAAIQD